MDIEAIEALYQKYKESPEAVEESFRFFFQDLIWLLLIIPQNLG